MTDSKVEVTVRCTLRVNGGRHSCPWELRATSIEEAAEMHRMHVQGQHS